MNMPKEELCVVNKRNAMRCAMALFLLANAAVRLPAQDSATKTSSENQSMTSQNKFHCNIKALAPEERARHKELTEKLIRARTATIEAANGYEFRYSPESVSLAEVAEWAVAESKCCPFFDFHIDLEKEGTLICLRLTGSEGVKEIIRAELIAR